MGLLKKQLIFANCLLLAAVFAVTFLVAIPTPGVTRPAPESFADLVAELTPAVVNIATSLSHEGKSLGNSPFDDLPPGAAPEE